MIVARKHAAAVVLACGLALAAITAGGAAHAQGRGDAARGESKAAACIACHGAGGQSTLAGTPSLAGQPPAFLELQMILFREGLRDVPAMNAAMKGLSDADIADLTAYFARATLAAPALARDDALYQRGAAVSRRMNCGSCHLGSYRGQQQVPRLASQREEYLAAAMLAFRDNKRSGTDTSMIGIMHGASDADIRALAHYFAAQ